MKDIKCRYAHPQEILIQFFSRNYGLVELRNLTKMKDTTETVCQRNSTEAQQNFRKLCSNEGHNVQSNSGDLLLWVGVRCASSGVRLHLLLKNYWANFTKFGMQHIQGTKTRNCKFNDHSTLRGDNLRVKIDVFLFTFSYLLPDMDWTK